MHDNRIDFGEQSILLGCGSGKSEVLHIDTEGVEKKQDVLCTMFNRGQQLSIYGLSVSPNMTYLAVATRGKINKRTGRVVPSELKVWMLDDLLGRNVRKLCLETFYPKSALVSVSITDDGSLLVGSASGELLFYELPGSTPVITQQAYSGAVFAVIAIGDRKWVSIGGQSVLKVWEKTDNKLILLWESAPSTRVKGAAMQSVAFSRSTETVYWGDGSGNIHWVDTSNRSFDNGFWEAHAGSITAISWHPELEQLVSGGLEDGFLKSWSSPNNPVFELKTTIPIVGISSQLGESVLLFDATSKTLSKISRVSLKGDSNPQIVAAAPFRSWVNFPIDVAVNAQNKSIASSIEEKIGLTELAIAAEEWGEARAFIDQLHEHGAGIQSLILLAKMHRARNHFLMEYHIWNELIKSDLNDEMYKVAHYGLGDVLDKIVEPELALKHFKLADDFSDAEIRAKSIIEHPLFEKSPFVRADLESKDRFHQEVFKNVTLNRRFTSIVVVEQLKSDIPLDPDTVSIDVLEKLVTLYKDRYIITKEIDILVEEVNLLKGQDRAPETIKWLRFVPSEDSATDSWIQFALSIEKFGTQCELLIYALFNPEEINYSTEDVQLWNKELGKIWERTSNEPVYSNWINEVSDKVENKILRIYLGRSPGGSF